MVERLGVTRGGHRGVGVVMAGPVPDSMMLRAALLAALVAMLLGGCGVDERRCEGPGGALGPCCVLALPGGETLEGACLDGRCRRADHPALAPPCDGVDAADGGDRGGLADGGLVDASRDAGDRRDGGGLDRGPASDRGAHDGGDPDGGDRCRAVVCDPGERCDPETGTCRSRRFGVPGGACMVDDDCVAGRCLTEAESGGAAPGGFCSVPCVDDGDCGFGACVEAADGRVCFEPCDDRDACRPGWTCRPDAARPICRVDCRVVGCPGQGRCDDETGVCGPPAVSCRYDCAVGEQCVDGRCVRVDGTCVTDYHCRRMVELCADGRCVPAEYSACDGDAACGAGQRCVPIEGGGGCLFACEADAACPADRVCRLDRGACVRPGCGGETGNGELLGECAFGGDAPGTCIPYEVRTPGAAPGFCVEAGLAEPGEPCDAQSDGRDAVDRAVQCGPGAICRGDPDDPLDPMQRWGGRGTCAALCSPGEGGCAAGRCVDFGAVDDPGTPQDETRAVGLCLPVECEVLGAGCAAGARCRAYGLTDRAGVCSPAGEAAAGEACGADDDCADEALCVSRGGGTECLPICDPADEAACGGRPCYADVGWQYGVCL